MRLNPGGDSSIQTLLCPHCVGEEDSPEHVRMTEFRVKSELAPAECRISEAGLQVAHDLSDGDPESYTVRISLQCENDHKWHLYVDSSRDGVFLHTGDPRVTRNKYRHEYE